MSLLDQQRALQRAIVGSTPSDAAVLRALPDRGALLHIYRHAYTARLVGALRDNFGVLPTAMGDEAFDALAQAYVAANPSQHPSIRWFGDRFAAFMAERETLVGHPALVDLARMEWALRAAFDAADAPTLDAATLGAQPPDTWPHLVFDALPSVQVIDMQWAVEPLWRALKNVDAEAATEQQWPEPVQNDHALLVWRQGFETRWRAVEATQAALLRAMFDGQTFASLCEVAAREAGEDQAAATAVDALRHWLNDGLLRGWRLQSG